MNSTPDDVTSSGRFVRAGTQSVKPVEVDCTGWEQPRSPDEWSTGNLLRLTHAMPPIAESVIAAASPGLEIALRVDASMSAASAFVVATQLVAAALAHELGQGLTCDPDRSAAQADEVVIVLKPRWPNPSTAARLEQLADVVRKAANGASGIVLSRIQIVRAA